MKSPMNHKNRTNISLILLLITITVACLIPFVRKAFHIDDTLFLLSAKQVLTNPFDFFGFSTNWYGTDMPMYQITKNPPLASYYIAAIAALFGWSEIALHLAFMLPAVGVVVGSYYLARGFCMHPAMATLAALFTPVFMISSTNVMCDTMMLCFWVWAVFFWIEGLEKESLANLFISALLMMLCIMTKYYGISLIPLLLIYSLFKKKGIGTWAFFLLIPVLTMAVYQWETNIMYGRGLLLDAASYATNISFDKGAKLLEKGMTGLAFTGGCIAVFLFYLPFIWPRRVQLLLLAVAAVCIFLFPHIKMFNDFSFARDGEISWGSFTQFVVFALVGLNLLLVTLMDFWKNKDAESMLLLLWIYGTFIFASFINWSVNGRSILPMIPAAAFLMMRHIERKGVVFEGKTSSLYLIPLIPAALLAFLVTSADYSLANSAREATAMIHDRYSAKAGTRWFEGHWGFHYYMEHDGARPIDVKSFKFSQGDIVVVPRNNTNLIPLDQRYFKLVEILELPLSSFAATMNSDLRAGFYSDVWGALPFKLGNEPPEQYFVFSYVGSS